VKTAEKLNVFNPGAAGIPRFHDRLISHSIPSCFMARLNHILSAGLVAHLLLVGAAAGAGAQDKPNVILLMTDDQGYGDLACHGNPVIRTPNLDRLYAQSVRFTDFHVNPFCSPTRAALMTGRFSDRTHVRTTVYSRNHLNRDETTMAEFFRASGYRTGHFGKWHLGRNYPYRPIDRGFDQWVGHGDGGTGTASDYWDNDKMNDTYMRNGRWEKFTGFCTDIYFDEAMRFIEQDASAPFFIYLATNVPHGPWNVPRAWRTPYLDAAQGVIDFFATISRMDDNLGRLRDCLARNNLAENTILVFLTDNGTSGGASVFNAGMRGRKGSIYDGGHRVPCFLHWPDGGMDQPLDIGRLTGHIDLLPTLVELCKLKTPARGHLEFDGRSLVPLIRKTRVDWPDRTIFLHSQNVKEKPVKWQQALVATERWRLVNGKELYDIQADPGQKTDLANKHPETVSDLRQRYETHWSALRLDQHPYPRPIVGSPHAEETWLTCDAWIRDRPMPHTWDQSHVRAAAPNGGFWPIEVAQEGTYRFDVYRWPKEANRAITDTLPKGADSDIERQGRPVFAGAGKAIPAVKTRIEVGSISREKDVAPGDVRTSFTLSPAKGPTRVRAWFIDEQGKKRAAYYVYIHKL
jgi:arylsulfatase B